MHFILHTSVHLKNSLKAHNSFCSTSSHHKAIAKASKYFIFYLWYVLSISTNIIFFKKMLNVERIH